MKDFLSRWLARPVQKPVLQAPLDLMLALHTDTGPVREHNEDCIAALNAPAAEGDRTTLVALADGMGGHQAGELASRLAVEAALRSFGQPQGTPVERLHAALAAANEAVYSQAQQDAQWQGMGTTLVLFAPTEHGGFVAWVGDSRLYLWREGVLTQITRDDTLVRGLLERGIIAASEAAAHPDASVLTQAVGTHATIPSPHVHGPVLLQAGDRVLLTSDGVHDVVSEHELATALQADSPHDAVQRIHAAALRNGANDNISIGVALMRTPQAAPPAPRSTRSDIEVST